MAHCAVLLLDSRLNQEHLSQSAVTNKGLHLYTILHVSDLHRNEGSAVSNEEILSSLVADSHRSAGESPSLQRPDSIVVSGDLVEGLSLASKAYPAALRQQYEVAEELLIELAAEFLDGDRSRVILVPGNHDVDWNRARQALALEEHLTHNIHGFVSDPESPYRWSWADRQVFRISNQCAYESRFEYFNEMYSRFYQNAQLLYEVDPGRPWNLFALDSGNIVIAAFNSCIVNDCFANFGHIRAKDVADCHLAMRRIGRPGFLPIAVWHHGVGGSPWASDYLDPNTLKLIIDKGFRLALHGHRHDSSISPVDLFVSTRETMAVIGAGSLCARETSLPHGVNQRYNIIRIEREDKQGTVHVREMNQPGIWGPGQLFESGGDSVVDFHWTASSLEVATQGTFGSYSTDLADSIERMINAGSSEEAIEVLSTDALISNPYRRRLLAKALESSERWTELKALLKSPENEAELALYYSASERSGDLSGVDEVLRDSDATGEFDSQLLDSLKRRFMVRKTLGRRSQ